jgi:DNA-3-methyladenine glycosylase I
MPGKAPPKFTPESLRDYFEVLTKAVFQSGISWGVVEARWGGLTAAFERFEPAKVARFTPDTVDALMREPRMVRNRRKIEATVDNALEILALEQEHGDFRGYLDSHADLDDLTEDLARRFQCLGEDGASFFVQTVGAD